MNKPNSSLSQFIEEYPLYSKFGTDQPIEAADLNDLVFNFFCKAEKEIQPFRLTTALNNGNGTHHSGANFATHHNFSSEGAIIDFTEIFTGVCQSCEKDKVNIIINGATQKEKPRYFIRKIGQYPAPESYMAKLPVDISDFLIDESREFYRRALKNLEFEYGIGALAYFKRMIKNEIERIIEALSNPYSADGNKINEIFASYQECMQKTKFIEEVTPHLPRSLKEHGANILLVLHDTISINMHELSEKECIKKSKDIDSLFRYIIRRISAEMKQDLAEKIPGKYFLRYS